ncbi:hypothetical protein QP028_14995 [Corynebacterium suedekumii]|nr:hypothetical protein QP028_14995 [Corynebacterium suedekumii]
MPAKLERIMEIVESPPSQTGGCSCSPTSRRPGRPRTGTGDRVVGTVSGAVSPNQRRGAHRRAR